MNNFFVIDGPDGCGKTTLIENLKKALLPNDDIVFCQDPGSTELGQHLRSLLKYNTHLTQRVDKVSEMLLFTAVRNELIAKIIRPALAAGKVVICDRFTISTIVYQGFVAGIPFSKIIDVDTSIREGLRPNLTFLINISPETICKRIQARNQSDGIVNTDNFEGDLDRITNIVKGYRYFADVINPNYDYLYPIQTVSGEQTQEELLIEVLTTIITRTT